MSDNVLEYSTVHQHEKKDTIDPMSNAKVVTVPSALHKDLILQFGWWWKTSAIAIGVISIAALITVLLQVDCISLSCPRYVSLPAEKSLSQKQTCDFA
jgi:hypothetical protein